MGSRELLHPYRTFNGCYSLWIGGCPTHAAWQWNYVILEFSKHFQASGFELWTLWHGRDHGMFLIICAADWPWLMQCIAGFQEQWRTPQFKWALFCDVLCVVFCTLCLSSPDNVLLVLQGPFCWKASRPKFFWIMQGISYCKDSLKRGQFRGWYFKGRFYLRNATFVKEIHIFFLL